MELRVLEYFLAVCHEGSFSKAADRIHITQPTLSRQLAQLEDELQTKLFERTTRSVALTQAGIYLRQRAEEILSLTAQTMDNLKPGTNTVQGTLFIGCGETAAANLLLDMIAEFSNLHPLIRFQLYTLTADKIAERISNGKLDVGLMMEPTIIPGDNYIRFFVKEQRVVVMRADDPLAVYPEIVPENMAGQTLMFPYRTYAHKELETWLGTYYRKEKVVYSFNLVTNGYSLVEKTGGYFFALKDAGALPYLDPNRLTYRPLKGFQTTEKSSVLIWNPLCKSKALEIFLNHARKFIENAGLDQSAQ